MASEVGDQGRGSGCRVGGVGHHSKGPVFLLRAVGNLPRLEGERNGFRVASCTFPCCCVS